MPPTASAATRAAAPRRRRRRCRARASRTSNSRSVRGCSNPETDEPSVGGGTSEAIGSFARLADALDDLDQLVGAVALLAGEADKLAGTGEDGTALRCTCDMDAATTPELEQPFIAEQAERTEHRVGVDVEHCGEVAGGW